MIRSIRLLFGIACAIGLAGILTIGCEQPSSPGTSATAVDPATDEASLGKGGHYDPLSGQFDQVDFEWIVSHFSEQICTNGQSLVAGAAASFMGNTSPFGDTEGTISAAWDWRQPAGGHYTPEGPATGTSATVLGSAHRFETNPFASSNPLLPVCERRVTADGIAMFMAADGKRKRGHEKDDDPATDDQKKSRKSHSHKSKKHHSNKEDRIDAKITGGEVYELSFGNFPGDGQEQFIELQITGGLGHFKKARGSLVIHNIFDFSQVQPGQNPLVKSEIIEGQIRR